jgi:type II secretory pathway pseudopilin PulG
MLYIRRGFTLLEAVIALALIFILATSVVLVFRDSTGSEDIKARSALIYAKKILDKNKGYLNIDYLNNLESEYIFTSDASTESNVISISSNNDTTLFAVSNGNNGCWLLKRNYIAEDEGSSSIYGYKFTDICSNQVASILESTGGYGKIDKPVLL